MKTEMEVYDKKFRRKDVLQVIPGLTASTLSRWCGKDGPFKTSVGVRRWFSFDDLLKAGVYAELMRVGWTPTMLGWLRNHWDWKRLVVRNGYECGCLVYRGGLDASHEKPCIDVVYSVQEQRGMSLYDLVLRRKLDSNWGSFFSDPIHAFSFVDVSAIKATVLRRL